VSRAGGRRGAHRTGLGRRASECARADERPRVELADIVRQYGEALRKRRILTPEQHAVLRAIARCRTEALGGHLDVCQACGHETPSYNSCRDRHCPKCQALAQARWVQGRTARLLHTPYFHVVFTLPAELRSIAKLNRRFVFDAMARIGGRLSRRARHGSETPWRARRRHIVKIRHYGLHAPSHVASELAVAQAALAPKASPSRAQSDPDGGDDGLCDWLAQLTRADVGVCPACGARAVVRKPLPAARAPPEAAA
jgi:hypothetical protein